MIILILIATLIIGIAGVSSLALFSGEISSSGKITGTVARPKPLIGADTLIKKVGTGGLVAESHPATGQLAATTAYRYTGANPDNYVSFNNELWRIIGVFEVDDGTGNIEKRIKLRKKDGLIPNASWDTNQINRWTSSTGIQRLNGIYWNRTSVYASTGLLEESKLMVDDAKWYLAGGISGYESTSKGLASHFYGYERGTSVPLGYSANWVGKIGIMYPSDYGYATSGGSTKNRDACLAQSLYFWSDSLYSDCKNNDWLFESSESQWTITFYRGDSTSAFSVLSDGKLYATGVAGTHPYYPCLYLSSDVLISGGSGTEADPYLLSK